MKVCLLPCGRPIGHWRIWGQKSSSEFFKVVLSAAAAATAEATAAEQESPQSPSLGFSSESAKLFRPKSVHRVSFDGERGDRAPMKHATTTQYNAKWENSVVFKYSVAFKLPHKQSYFGKSKAIKMVKFCTINRNIHKYEKNIVHFSNFSFILSVVSIFPQNWKNKVKT